MILYYFVLHVFRRIIATSYSMRGSNVFFVILLVPITMSAEVRAHYYSSFCLDVHVPVISFLLLLAYYFVVRSYYVITQLAS
jgi:hypothetical protein